MTRFSRPAAAVLAALSLPSPGSAAPAAEPFRVGESSRVGESFRVGDALLEPVDTAALPGFPGADPAATLAAFRRTCRTPPATPQPATVTGSAEALAAACARAETVAETKTVAEAEAEAARFFSEAFAAYRIVRPAAGGNPERRTGFLTGYFEPELVGSATPSPDFTAAVLARPDDLVGLEPGETRPGLDPALRAARRVGDGFEPYPDRAAIEDGVLGDRARPLLYLRDAVDLFVLQVQGSGRVRLTDGRSVRVLYDGRNGRPYTSIGKLIVAEGHLPLDGLTLARWTGWLRANPAQAKRLMRVNASYIFFRLAEIDDPALGPPGGAGVPLSPGRNLAVDATLWRYGLPFWLEGRIAGSPDPGRLVVAADTGSAIVGPARGDLYLGTGAEAGIAAGNLRDPVGFVVLLPKPETNPKPSPETRRAP